MRIPGFLRHNALSKLNTTPATKYSRFTSGAIKSSLPIPKKLAVIPSIDKAKIAKALFANNTRFQRNQPTDFWYRRMLATAVEHSTVPRMAEWVREANPQRYNRLVDAIRRRRMGTWKNS